MAKHGLIEEKPKKSKRKKKANASHSHSEAYSYKDKSQKVYNSHKSKNNKPKGKGVIIFVAVACVVVAGALGTAMYFKGLNNLNSASTADTAVATDNNEETTEHSDLVVITVEGESIAYNGEEVESPQSLKEKLDKEENPTFSLINLSADAEVYNSVVTILNDFGAGYELMDDSNTNPSISTNINEDTTS